MDIHRQPEKILEVIESITPKLIQGTLRAAEASDCPIVIMPLHKGDDSFMSDEQFEKLYWPSLKRVMLGLVEEGLVPVPFAEGSYNRRLDVISDVPRGSIVWYFDRTDMKQAKEKAGKTTCIMGNTPASLLITGTEGQVKEDCRKLIENCAPGGGFILTGGAQIDSGSKIGNLRAMMAAAKEWGVYSHPAE
jgi:uroporphyrinogen-III decarboxylase